MGGWAAAQTAAKDHGLFGVVLISPWDIGHYSDPALHDRAYVQAFMEDDHETLVGKTPTEMTDDAIAHKVEWSFAPLVPALVDQKILLLCGNRDEFLLFSDDLQSRISSAGGKRLTYHVVPTDHVWSDRRIALQSLVITWLNGLLAKKG
jgi:acetyl esterase/lipase